MNIECENKLPEFTEYETKYRVSGDQIYDFKKIMESTEDLEEFIYVQGPDIYFTRNEDDMFARYRKVEHDNSGMSWLTFKKKPDGAKTNIKRKEYNWRVDVTPFKEIEEGLVAQGYQYNFAIYKMCHIYKFEDATCVFYTVRDRDNDKLDHFLEIEVDEQTISSYSEKEALGIIRKYETILESMGNITHRNRLSKSLFEMYVRG